MKIFVLIFWCFTLFFAQVPETAADEVTEFTTTTTPAGPAPAPPLPMPKPEKNKLGLVPFSGIEFTDEEKELHQVHLKKFLSTASTCIQRHLDKQKRFYEQYKIAAFYGHESDWAKWKKEGAAGHAKMVAKLTKLGVDYPEEVIPEIKPISCVNLLLDCLEVAFEKNKQPEAWEKLRRFAVKHHNDGSAIQHALQQLGWKILYWNPDTTQVKTWDQQEQKRFAKDHKDYATYRKFWGWHENNLWAVRKFGEYYRNKIDDSASLVDFGENVPRKFFQVPFFVGTAHQGFHVFPGYNGFVIEAHASRRITDRRTLEAGEFDPINKKERHPNGGSWGDYASGLIAVPPGYGY